ALFWAVRLPRIGGVLREAIGDRSQRNLGKPPPAPRRAPAHRLRCGSRHVSEAHLAGGSCAASPRLSELRQFFIKHRSEGHAEGAGEWDRCELCGGGEWGSGVVDHGVWWGSSGVGV